MNKQEAIELLNNKGWTTADAQRALTVIDFNINPNIDELAILRTASQFAGAELLNRQRLQAAQKGLVTRRNRKIQEYISQIEELTLKKDSAEIEKEIQKLKDKISSLVVDKTELEKEKSELQVANIDLEKDNKYLANLVHEIKFKLTVEIKDILKLDNILQIKKRLTKLLWSVLG